MPSFAMPNRPQAYLFLALVVIGMVTVQGDHWWPQWALMFPLLLAGMVFGRRLQDWLVNLTTMYFGLNACFTALWRQNQFEEWAVADRSIFRSNALDFFAGLILFFFFYAYTPVWASRAKSLLACLFHALITVTLFQLIFTSDPQGFLGNYGMNTSLLAILYPFSPGLIPAVLVTILIITSHASTPLLVWGVVLLSLYPMSVKRKLLVSGVVGAGTLLLLWKYRPEYLSDSARFSNWALYWRYFLDHNVWLGNGAASFKALGPMIQGENGETKEWLYWAHNEYLEILFEFGFLGLGLFLVCARRLVTRARGDFRAALLGAAACALTDYPLRLAVFVFVLVIIAKEVAHADES
jgi:hypothetical protein